MAKNQNTLWRTTAIVLAILVLILTLILVFGQNSGQKCSIKENSPNITSTQLITISGTDTTQEVTNPNPVRLVISGVRNRVTVESGTDIQELSISGVDILVYLPNGSTPKITDTGVRTKIIYLE